MKYIHYMKYNLHCIHHNLYMMCIHYNHRYRYRYMMNSLLSNCLNSLLSNCLNNLLSIHLSIQSHNLHHMNSNNHHHRSHRNHHSLRHLQLLYHSHLYNRYMRLRQFRCLVLL